MVLIFISTWKNYTLSIPLSLQPIKIIKEKISKIICTHEIQRQNYKQCGRFIAKCDTQKSFDFTVDFNLDFNLELEFDLIFHDIIPLLIYKQIARSDILYAVFTAAEQYQIVSEIQYALALQKPVFVKFCNCDQYDISAYSFVISCIQSFMKVRTIHLTDECFKKIDILQNWISEKDYLLYLEEIPICIGCHESFSKSLVIPYIDPTWSFNIHEDEVYDYVQHICKSCALFLRSNLRKFIKSQFILQLILEYYGI